ncbi:MAG TPA: sulfurtransferase [Ferrovaceae bacterium]|nr:sulfurtransferase [Ferrovaceae bacterium]
MMNPVLNAQELLLDHEKWIIIDCRYQLTKPDWGYQQYLENHLPGARFVHLDRDLSGVKTGTNGRHPLPHPDHLQALFRQLGINQNARVVAYDDAGGCFAARLWWSLKWLGFDQAAILNGGIESWVRVGGELTPELPQVSPGHFTGEPRQEWVIGVDEIEKNLNSQYHLLMDARSSDRFRGENESIDPRAGHIPGAINRPFTDNLDESKCFKLPQKLQQEFGRLLEPSPNRQIIHQCGSGVSACHNWLAMHYAGMTPALKLYPGSWSEWVANPSRPIAR